MIDEITGHQRDVRGIRLHLELWFPARPPEPGPILMTWRAVLVLACFLVTFAGAPAIADQDRLKDAGDAVPGHPGLTYADLVRQAVPDLGPSADDRRVEGHFRTPPRHL